MIMYIVPFLFDCHPPFLNHLNNEDALYMASVNVTQVFTLHAG